VELELAAGSALRVSLVDTAGRGVGAEFQVSDALGRSYAAIASPQDLEVFLRDGYTANGRSIGPLWPGRYGVEARALDGRNATGAVTLAAGETRELVLKVE
jgi:hypothetical protein